MEFPGRAWRKRLSTGRGRQLVRWLLTIGVGLLLGVVLQGGLALRHRVAKDWHFTGADGYVYMDAASELAQNHSYGARLPLWIRNQPKVAPLTYCRPPGYPLFIVAVAHPPLADYESFFARLQPVQAVIDVLTCLLVFALAHRLGGLVAAWPALLFAVGSPFLALYAGSILTETLAIFLTTAVLTLLAYVLTSRPGGSAPWRSSALWIVAGALTGLAALVRADGLLVAPCLLLPLLRPSVPLGRRLRVGALSLLALTVVLLPWPLRNYHRFGGPHLWGHMCETSGAAVERTAVQRWLATWMEEEESLPTTLWCLLNPHCVAKVDDYPPQAFDSAAERAQVAALLELQRRERFSARFDAGFAELAAQRRQRQPLRSYLQLPLRRLKNLWVSSNDLPIRAIARLPWPEVTTRLQPHFKQIFLYTDGLAVAGLLALLLLPGWRRSRAAGLLALVALGTRSGYLAIAGYVESRYILELLPLSLALGGVALGAVASLLCAGLARLTGGIRRSAR